MPQEQGSQQSGYGGGYGGSYTIKNCGTNAQGNHYCTRDYSSSGGKSYAYHYSNSDGSYYYRNSNTSTYYNDGKGNAFYTPPSHSKK